MNDLQFEENISRILRNDKSGLRAIYEDYNGMIYSMVICVLHMREDAEDVTSEFFIRLWDIADTYRSGSGHRAWMLTIARNMAIDHMRKHHREVLAADIPEYLQPEQAAPEEQLCERLGLEQALTTLKEEERQIVNLKIMGELTFQEIAGMLKKPLGTVTWRYRTAIQKLKRCSYD